MPGVWNMSERIRLTERDVRIIAECYRNTVVSFSQVHNRHFPGASDVTVSNRIGQLVRSGFLAKTRLQLPMVPGRGNGTAVMLFPTRLGLKVLRRLFPDDPIRIEPVPFNPYNAHHDLTLNDAALALEKHFLGLPIINGRIWENGQNHAGKRNPDAIILNSQGKS
jgi:hypothetical protein